MNVHNWIQKDSLTQKMIFRNIPHKLQQWDQYTYIFSLLKRKVYKFQKYNKEKQKDTEKQNTSIDFTFMITCSISFASIIEL